MSKLLTIQECAATVALSVPQLYKLSARGEFIKPLKIGRSARFLQSELQEWIESRSIARQLANGNTA
jgi:excisionase family DNA binding protein